MYTLETSRQAREIERFTVGSERQKVDQAIRNTEKLVRESGQALDKLREERERSEHVIQESNRGSSRHAGKGNAHNGNAR